jgi:hypothetical protein
MIERISPSKLLLVVCAVAVMVIPLAGCLIMGTTHSFIGGIDISTAGFTTELDPIWFWPFISLFILVAYVIPVAILFAVVRHRSVSTRNRITLVSSLLYAMILVAYLLYAS